MIYTVSLDGNEIYDLNDKQRILISPELTLSTNSSGSLEFTMPPMHQSYEALKPLTSVVTIKRDGKCLFAGRPVEISTDFYKDKKVYCEGLLALLNDTYMPKRNNTYSSIDEMLRDVFYEHNRQKPGYTFRVGTINVESPTGSYKRETDLMSCWNWIKQCITGSFGVRLMADYTDIESKVIKISIFKNALGKCNQPIKFGLNMLDYTYGLDLKNLATGVIAVGTDEDDNQITSGEVWNNDLVNTYGKILKIVSPSDVKTVDGLKTYANQYLSSIQYDTITIEGKASSLFSINQNYEDFTLGQAVEVISKPHGMNKWFPITEIKTKLDSAEQSITVGNKQQSSSDAMRNGMVGGSAPISRTGNSGWSHWIGTRSEYSEIKNKDPNTVYFIRGWL